MKTIGITLSFIIWCAFTLLLVCSLIGIVILIREDHNVQRWQGEEGEAAWFKIGKKLINKLTE